MEKYINLKEYAKVQVHFRITFEVLLMEHYALFADHRKSKEHKRGCMISSFSLW